MLKMFLYAKHFAPFDLCAGAAVGSAVSTSSWILLVVVCMAWITVNVLADMVFNEEEEP